MSATLRMRRWTAAACAAIMAMSLAACAPEASSGLTLPTQVATLIRARLAQPAAQ